jgi:hypothetical protein
MCIAAMVFSIWAMAKADRAMRRGIETLDALIQREERRG